MPSASLDNADLMPPLSSYFPRKKDRRILRLSTERAVADRKRNLSIQD
jgi:hypothetical protein